jgi:hypothetical protein
MPNARQRVWKGVALVYTMCPGLDPLWIVPAQRGRPGCACMLRRVAGVEELEAPACQGWSFVTPSLRVQGSPYIDRPVARPRQHRRRFLLSVARTCRHYPSSFRAPSQPTCIADAPACAIAGPAQHLRQHHVALRLLAQCRHGKVRRSSPAWFITLNRNSGRNRSLPSKSARQQASKRRLPSVRTPALPFFRARLTLAQANMSAAALSTHGTTRAPPPSGRG